MAAPALLQRELQKWEADAVSYREARAAFDDLVLELRSRHVRAQRKEAIEDELYHAEAEIYRWPRWSLAMFFLNIFLVVKKTFGQFLANFERPVLGCIDATFCK